MLDEEESGEGVGAQPFDARASDANLNDADLDGDEENLVTELDEDMELEGKSFEGSRNALKREEPRAGSPQLPTNAII